MEGWKVDTTKEYIKQCAMAKWLQRQWKPKYGDCYSVDGHEVKIICYPDTLDRCWKDMNFTGVFRQDQLQDMMKDDHNSWGKLFDFYNYVNKHFEWKPNWDISFEQLRLAFVMWEKWGKIWNRIWSNSDS